MRIAWIPTAALMLLPATLRAQNPALSERVDAATRSVVEPILEAAALDSLPVRALESKVLEGVAKGRPTEQIARVVTELADDFRRVRSELRAALPAERISDGEVVAAALATRQGVGLEAVRSLWQAKPDGESLEIPLTVLGDLVRRGVPVEDASDVVAYVVRASVPLQVAAQIPGRVDGALVSGAAPSAALVSALRTLNISVPAGRRPNE